MIQENYSVLHIGYPKTATTWFQEQFYPKIKDIEFYDQKRSIQSLGIEWQNIKNTKNILKSLKLSNKRLVICDESMVGKIEWIEKNARSFKEIFYPAQIIILIRNQMDKYISNYSQYIKSGGTAKFIDYLFTPSYQIFRGEQHRYDMIISTYKEYFGNSNVYVYLYEDLCFDYENFIKKFCSNHNFILENGQINMEKVNIRLSRTLLNLKRLSNFFTRYQPIQTDFNNPKHTRYFFHIPYWYQIMNILFEKANTIFFRKNNLTLKKFISQEQIQIMKDYFAVSNNKLITEHGLINIKKYNYPL